jgi:hypothetical protein
MIKLLPKVSLSLFTSAAIALPVLLSFALPIQPARSEQVVRESTDSKITNKDKQDKGIRILLVNRTGSTLTSLQVAPAKTRQWDANILDRDLPNGNERSIKIAEGRSECRRDLRATFENGSTIEDFDVDICKNDIYTFTVSGLW